MRKDNPLQQWSIWPLAFIGLVACSILFGLLPRLGLPNTIMGALAVLGSLLGWFCLPKLAFYTWLEGDQLCWRWGILRHGPTSRLPLAQISQISVQTLPDQPKRPVRMLADGEVHGGSFTPKLNRGVKLQTRDGRTFYLGLPRPSAFAQALQAAMPQETP